MLCFNKIVPEPIYKLDTLIEIIFKYDKLSRKYNWNSKLNYLNYSTIDKIFSLKAHFDALYFHIELNYDITYYIKIRKRFYKMHNKFILKILKMYNLDYIIIENIIFNVKFLRKTLYL